VYLGFRVVVALDAGARCEGLKGGIFEEVDVDVAVRDGSVLAPDGSRLGASLLVVVVVTAGGSTVPVHVGFEAAIAAEEELATLVPEPPVAVPRVTRSATPIPITITATDSDAVRIHDRNDEREMRRSGIGGVLCRPDVGDGEGK